MEAAVRSSVNSEGPMMAREKTDSLCTLMQIIAAIYNSPSNRLYQDVSSGNLQEVLAELASDLDLPPVELADMSWQNIEAAYVSLFVSNPAGVPAQPYVAYLLDGELLGPKAQELNAFYQQQGFTVSESWHDLPDHVAAVAEASLQLLEVAAEDAAMYLLNHYILPWFKRHATVVQNHDPSHFYGPITVFLAQALVEVTREVSS